MKVFVCVDGCGKETDNEKVNARFQSAMNLWLENEKREIKILPLIKPNVERFWHCGCKTGYSRSESAPRIQEVN